MNYKNSDILNCFEKWKAAAAGCMLPSWDELPTLDLYMDQVVILLNQYLDTEKAAITPPMINNYVKLKIIPAPVKKKYSRLHLVYLIMVCTLKQTLSMATIQKILPLESSEDEIKQIYSAFIKNQQSASEYISKQVRELAGHIPSGDENPMQAYNIIMEIVASANIFKRLADDMLSTGNTEEEQKEKSTKTKQEKKKK